MKSTQDTQDYDDFPFGDTELGEALGCASIIIAMGIAVSLVFIGLSFLYE